MKTRQIERLFELQRERYVFEDIIRAVYEAISAPGDLMVDGGANSGMHTIPMADAVPNGLVVAFEPVPDTISRLKKNVGARENVVIRNAALGESPGKSCFTWVENKSTRSALLVPKMDPDFVVSQIETDIVRLDDEIMQDWPQLTFIKLDLEGGEYHALKGASETLANFKPVIVFENAHTLSSQTYGYSAADFFGLFAKHGYKLFDLFGRPYGPEQWGDWSVPSYAIAAQPDSPADQIAATACRKIVSD